MQNWRPFDRGPADCQPFRTSRPSVTSWLTARIPFSIFEWLTALHGCQKVDSSSCLLSLELPIEPLGSIHRQNGQARLDTSRTTFDYIEFRCLRPILSQNSNGRYCAGCGPLHTHSRVESNVCLDATVWPWQCKGAILPQIFQPQFFASLLKWDGSRRRCCPQRHPAKLLANHLRRWRLGH